MRSQLREALNDEGSRGGAGLVCPQFRQATGGAYGISGSNQAINFLASFRAVHGFTNGRDSLCALQILHQQFLTSVDPRDAPPPKGNCG